MNEPIQDKAPKPAGLLPKHVQSWLILGLAVLMVIIMWLTSPKKSLAPAKSNTPSTNVQAPLQVNRTEIAELQNRIAELQRQEIVAQDALEQQTKLLSNTRSASRANQSAEAGNYTPSQSEDPLEAERKKRQYLSLFASNVALSYRKNFTNSGLNSSATETQSSALANPASSPSAPDMAQIAQLLKQMQPPIAAQIPIAIQPSVAPPTSSASAKEHDTKEATQHPAAPIARADVAAGETYILFEGTFLEGILINRLDSSFTGPVECLLSDDSYSHDRQHLLIPTGTKILGEAKKVEAFGQTRLAVVFHRLIMPDGYSVSLDKFKGLDQIGDTGLRDKVNNHYLRIFGVSLAIGALGAVAETGTGSAFTESESDLMRQQFASNMAQSSEQILDRFLNIMPTVTIREGHRVKIYLSGDLALPDYNDHKMPSDL